MNELNLTPTQALILIPILFYLVWKLWRYESLIELDISPQIDKVEENTTDYVQERYGAYIQHFQLNLSRGYLIKWMNLLKRSWS